MKISGFVIHGNNVETLEAAIESLTAVCDEVLALDSESSDGSVDVAIRAGARSVTKAWEGYGAARANAVALLGSCDYVMYLDSDERMGPEAIGLVRQWRESKPTAPVFLLPRRDWAELPGRRFIFRTEWRARLVQREFATWKPSMIVHEALPRIKSVRLPAPIDHRFATSIELRGQKERRYALLWALRALDEGRRSKPASLQRVAHMFRDGVIHGAFFRGGVDAARLAWKTAGYHADKYQYLRQLRDGHFADLVELYRQGRYGELFAEVSRLELAG